MIKALTVNTLSIDLNRTTETTAKRLPEPEPREQEDVKQRKQTIKETWKKLY